MIERLFESRTTVDDGVSWQSWFLDLFSSGNTSTGITVSEELSLGVTAVYACVNILGNTVGKLPFQAFEKTKSGRQRLQNHNVARLIETRPNPFQTPFVFKKMLETHRNLWGNAYANIEFDRYGFPVAIWPLNPKNTEPYFDPDKKELWYVTRLPNGETRKLHHEEVIHLPGMVIEGFKGLSPIRVARESIALGLSTKEFVGRFYKNGTSTRGILKVPQPLKQPSKDKLREEWEKANSGLDNFQRVAVLDAGMEYQSISMPLADAQFIETLKDNLDDIARIFNVPPHMIGNLERATFNNIEHMGLEYLQNTMEPILVLWEEEFAYKLFLMEESKKCYLKFNVNSLLRGDSKSRAEYYRTMSNIGAYNINQIRALEDMDEIEHGDKHYMMINMAPIEVLEQVLLEKYKAKSGGEGAGEGETDTDG